MSYLLDTCIISKLRKIKSDSDELLQSWILSHAEKDYFISALTIGEIQFGISKLNSKESKKKMVLEDWLLGDLISRFKDRILPLDVHTTSIWGSIRGKAHHKGMTLSVIDALIAATAIQYNLILVTENIKDFLHAGVHLINPCQRL